MVKTNIVIPVLNRPKHTEQAIKSLYKNTNKKMFSLLVVNDGSDNETSRLLKGLQQEYGFDLLINPVPRGPGATRNNALEYLKRNNRAHKYLHNGDNDVYFMPGWLEVLVAVYEDVSRKGVALVGGGCHPYLKNNEVLDSVNGFRVGIKDAVSGYSHFTSWEIWERFGPFDTQEGLRKKTGRSDDWKFCRDVCASGLKVGALEPEVVIACGKTDTYGDGAVGPETFATKEGIYIA